MQDDLLGMPGSGHPGDGSTIGADGPELSGLIRIEATSYREALRRIGERFGKDVSIVHSRVIRRKGMLGALGATGVEVYVTGRAQYEEWKSDSWRRPEAGSSESPRIANHPPLDSFRDRDPAADPEPRRPAVEHRPAEEPRRVDEPRILARGTGGAPQQPDLARLLRSYQGQMSDVLREAQPQRRSEPVRPVLPSARSGGAPRAVEEHPIVREARRVLEAGDFSRQMERDIIGRLSQRRLPGTSGHPEEVRSLTRIQLGELVRSKVPPCVPIKIAGTPGVPRVVSVVGPTGVGKTTTIAKLASPFHFNDRLRVGLVTLDTYRIGAVDQLRKFADIMGLRLEVVPPGGTVRDAIQRLGDCDVVFLDTAGRSQNDAKRLAETRDMLRGIGSLEVHLCLSMAASRNANLEVLRKFRVVPYNRIILTKLDESSAYGSLLDIFAAARTAVSYMTCGQEVPDDIRAASVDRLESLILGDR